MKRVPHAECEFPIFGVTLIPTGGSLSRKYPLTPVGGGLEWDSWARIWPPPKGSATAPEVRFEEIFPFDLPEARFWITDPEITGAAGLVDCLRSNLNTATVCPVTQDKAVVERCNAGYNITPTNGFDPSSCTLFKSSKSRQR